MKAPGDRGSTLLLFPAALLVVVVLAAVTVDLARLHLAQRQLDDLAAAAANDVTTLGLDEAELRRSGTYRLDAGRVRTLVATVVRARRSPLLDHVRAETEVVDPRTVGLRFHASVELPFARALPRTPEQVTVRAHAMATAHLR